MAKMKSGIRSPTAHRTKEQARKHGKKRSKANPTGTTKRDRLDRAKNNAARAKVKKKLGASAVKGKDVGHKTPLSKGGSNAASNLKVQSKKKNRGHGMTRGRKPNSNKR
jgi:hypothetical protein